MIEILPEFHVVKVLLDGKFASIGDYDALRRFFVDKPVTLGGKGYKYSDSNGSVLLWTGPSGGRMMINSQTEAGANALSSWVMSMLEIVGDPPALATYMIEANLKRAIFCDGAGGCGCDRVGSGLMWSHNGTVMLTGPQNATLERQRWVLEHFK